MEETVLAVRNICKSFPGVVALDDVSLTLRAGEIHALIGENGAGKSTLIKCLSGAHAPTSGTIECGGRTFSALTPREAHDLGIRVIHQELCLVDGLSAAENISLGEREGRFVSFRRMEERAAEVFERMGVELDPAVSVSELSIAQQQLVEIARAISRDARVLIMDEPTSPLTAAESRRLFTIMRGLKEKGIAILFITHRLDEVLEVADRVSVLRDGRFVDERPIAGTDRDELIRLMIGRELTNVYPPALAAPGAVALEARHVSGCGVRDVSITVRRGEIVGLAGLVGSGRTELARMIFGADRMDSGEIYLDGEKVTLSSPRRAIEHGLGLIPENRKEQGVFLTFGVDWNISVSVLARDARGPFVNTEAIRLNAERLCRELDIRTPFLEQEVEDLSGGNQQKVALAKTLVTDSSILLFDEPTRGIDVGAKAEIYRILRSLADEGRAIVMISSDMEELLGMSDRIYVLAEGVLTGELSRDAFDSFTLMKLMSGAAAGKEAAHG